MITMVGHIICVMLVGEDVIFDSYNNLFMMVIVSVSSDPTQHNCQISASPAEFTPKSPLSSSLVVVTTRATKTGKVKGRHAHVNVGWS